MTDSVTGEPLGSNPGGVPLLLHVQGRTVVGVGAGPVAAGKLLPLLAQGARLRVIAPVADDPIKSAAAEQLLRWERRGYQGPQDLGDAVLVVAATNRHDVNAEVAADAAKLGVPCVRADGHGSADFMGAVRRGPLTFAVSTSGASPALSARLREELDDAYGPEWGELAVLLGELRQDPDVRAALEQLPPGERHLKWRFILDTNILTLLRTGQALAAREVAKNCLFSSSD